ncbi:MAG: HAMP domain-containing protein [Spirochaetes bacterium]|nr:HAMP domain-containing protein [Spirochaetota bacterium]
MQHFRTSLRAKIIAAFVILSTALSGGLSVFNYVNLKDQLFSDMRRKLSNMAFLGAQTIDKAVFAKLVAKMRKEEIAPAESIKVEDTADYRKIYDQLNTIRESYPEMIRYAYTFVKAQDPNKALYVVDSLVLYSRQRAAKGLTSEEISHFNGSWEIKPYPAAIEAITTNRVTIERDFSFDKETQRYLLTGYAPIVDDRNAVLGYLGLDISDKDADRLLSESVRNSLYVTVAIVLLSLLISVYIGRVLTGTIVSLDNIVTRFAENDFSVRAKVSSKDEVGRLGYSLNQMATLIEESRVRLNALLAAYGRFVPQDYIKLLGKSDIVELKLGDYSQKQMTVLFTDIRGFTSLSEKMSPYENFAFINSFLKRMGPIVRNNHGIIDKYIGDAIMALFSDQPESALKTAIEMFVEMQDYNLHRKEQSFEPIDMGVGIHMGNIMVGTVGESERMDGTVIGDSVNLASRLEGLTKTYGAHILISEATFRLIPNRSKYQSRFLDRVIVKGKSEPVPIWEILDGKNDERTELKFIHRARFEEAVHLFHAGDTTTAFRIFQELSVLNAADTTTLLYIERCQMRLQGKKVQGVDEEYKLKV